MKIKPSVPFFKKERTPISFSRTPISFSRTPIKNEVMVSYRLKTNIKY